MSKRRVGKAVRTRRPRCLPFEFTGGNWYGREEEKAAARGIHAKSPFRYYGPECGFEVDRFEEEFARFVGTKHTLATNSGT